MKITVWKLWNEERKMYEHNHISDGYDPLVRAPIGRTEQQTKSWSRGLWLPLPAELIDGRIVSQLNRNLDSPPEL